MDFKQVFLSLTEYTTPWGTESDLENLLPKGVQKDRWGNYYIKVGNSKTIFTCHLDNYCKTKVKINHVIDGNIIKTDGKSILGGDNKAGVTCLLYLIDQSVPGYYFFFAGEEPILSGGCWGSTQVVQHKSDLIKQFDRAIAFDRKMTGSIITRQMAQSCCSDEFADALISQFSKFGVQMKKDPTGYYTDTGNMIELVSECTNISIGVWNEHHNEEYVDISYVETIAKAAAKIDWESLPTKRPTDAYVSEPVILTKKGKVDKKYNKFINRKEDAKLFQKVSKVLDDGDYLLKTKSDFMPGKEMIFNNWFEEKPLRVVIDGGQIIVNGVSINPKKLSRQINKVIGSKLNEELDRIDYKDRFDYASHIVPFPKKYKQIIEELDIPGNEIILQNEQVYIHNYDDNEHVIVSILNINIIGTWNGIRDDYKWVVETFLTSDEWFICNVRKEEWKGSWRNVDIDDPEIYRCDGIDGLIELLEEVVTWQ